MTHSTRIIPNIIDRHGEDAAFLWLLRDAAVNQPHFDLGDLAELEERLDANLDGLLVAGENGWQVAQILLEYDEPGEHFINAWLAGQGSDGNRLDSIMQSAAAEALNYRAMVSALAWRPLAQCMPLIDSLLNANDSDYYWLGIHLCALYRHDPDELFRRTFQLDDEAPARKARALRACGELGRKDLLPSLQALYLDSNTDCAFWALWSGALLGDESAYGPLKTFIFSKSAYSESALALLIRLLPIDEQGKILRNLAADPTTERLAIKGAGWSGSIGWIPGLLLRMTNDNLARVCGEAFSMLTGADLTYLDLDQDLPEDFQSGPTEDPDDDDVALDPDEDLPWPNRDVVIAWWAQNQSRFDQSRRVLWGEVISRESCYHVLVNGYQRQRQAAAMELCLMGEGMFPTSAPARIQRELLLEWLSQ